MLPVCIQDPATTPMGGQHLIAHAVEKGAAIAHQAMGAIGWTQEHVLQRFTRRMWGWREDFGSEAEWAVRLGERVAAKGADQIWPMLTTR